MRINGYMKYIPRFVSSYDHYEIESDSYTKFVFFYLEALSPDFIFPLVLTDNVQ